MASHLIIFAIAFTIAAAARVVMRSRSPLLIVAGAVLLTDCGLWLFVGDTPSALGLTLATLGSVVGATIGVLVTAGLLRVVQRR